PSGLAHQDGRPCGEEVRLLVAGELAVDVGGCWDVDDALQLLGNEVKACAARHADVVAVPEAVLVEERRVPASPGFGCVAQVVQWAKPAVSVRVVVRVID